MHTPKKLFPLLYDAVVRIEAFKSWRKVKEHPTKPWWHNFPGGFYRRIFTPGVHAFGLRAGEKVVGRKGTYTLKHDAVLLIAKDGGIFFGSDRR
jgi:hypothetical protein